MPSRLDTNVRRASWSRLVDASGATGGRITARRLDHATRQLATLLGAGIPVVQALQALARSQGGALGRLLDDVRRDIETGLTLERALARRPLAFDATYCSLVAAGELGGKLDSVLGQIAGHRERAARLRGKVTSALVYPAAVTGVATLAVGVVLAWVVPTFGTMFEQAGEALPLPTRVVIALSDALLAHGPWLVAGIALAACLLLRALRSSARLQARVEGWLLRLPLLGRVLAEAAAARWCRTLGMLLGAGVPLADALGTVGRVSGQHRLAEATRRIRRDTASGRRLAPEMTRSGCFPAVALQMVRIGEESGTLDTLLGRAAEDLEQSVEETVARMTTLLEPAIMLVLGVAMGGVIIALYLPVFRLGSAVA